MGGLNQQTTGYRTTPLTTLSQKSDTWTQIVSLLFRMSFPYVNRDVTTDTASPDSPADWDWAAENQHHPLLLYSDHRGHNGDDHLHLLRAERSEKTRITFGSLYNRTCLKIPFEFSPPGLWACWTQLDHMDFRTTITCRGTSPSSHLLQLQVCDPETGTGEWRLQLTHSRQGWICNKEIKRDNLKLKLWV